jgi:hypothetical protein
MNIDNEENYHTTKISKYMLSNSRFQDEDSDYQIFSTTTPYKITTHSISLTNSFKSSYSTKKSSQNYLSKIKNASNAKNDEYLISFHDKGENLEISRNKNILGNLNLNEINSKIFTTAQPVFNNFATSIQNMKNNHINKVKCQMKTSFNEQIDGIEHDLIDLPCSNIFSLSYVGNISYVCKSDGKFHIFKTDCINTEQNSLLENLKVEVKLLIIIKSFFKLNYIIYKNFS